MLLKLNTYGVPVFRKAQGDSTSQAVNQSVSLPIAQARNIQSRDKFTRSNPAFGGNPLEGTLKALRERLNTGSLNIIDLGQIVYYTNAAWRLNKFEEVAKLFEKYGEMFSTLSKIFSNEDFAKQLIKIGEVEIGKANEPDLRWTPEYGNKYLEIFNPLINACDNCNKPRGNLFKDATRSVTIEILNAEIDKLAKMFNLEKFEGKDYECLIEALLHITTEDIINLKKAKPDLSPKGISEISLYITGKNEKDTAKYMKMFTELLEEKYAEKLGFGGVKNLTYLFYKAKRQNIIENPEDFNKFKTYLSNKPFEEVLNEITAIKYDFFKQCFHKEEMPVEKILEDLDSDW